MEKSYCDYKKGIGDATAAQVRSVLSLLAIEDWSDYTGFVLLKK
jgi:hypothetical protein